VPVVILNSPLPSHYIGVEIISVAKKIAQNLNPVSLRFKGVDHSRFSDVMKITRSDISELGHGAIDEAFFGAPCEDFSFLRLLPNRKGKLPPEGSNPRPGLDGPKVQILRQCIKILTWVLECFDRMVTSMGKHRHRSDGKIRLIHGWTNKASKEERSGALKFNDRPASFSLHSVTFEVNRCAQ